MSEKKKKKDDLDTETTFADMNVEGFSWYDRRKKKGRQKINVDRKEYWKLVKAAFIAYIPVFLVLIAVCAFVWLFAKIWLG